mmetsp:Transcript_6286/g.17775  ORF Transcript_6286/g.17775 Transcript_6286/m.17775 type:complete len:202 (-) Transcript_6286:1169-1774(-)
MRAFSSWMRRLITSSSFWRCFAAWISSFSCFSRRIRVCSSCWRWRSASSASRFFRCSASMMRFCSSIFSRLAMACFWRVRAFSSSSRSLALRSSCSLFLTAYTSMRRAWSVPSKSPRKGRIRWIRPFSLSFCSCIFLWSARYFSICSSWYCLSSEIFFAKRASRRGRSSSRRARSRWFRRLVTAFMRFSMPSFSSRSFCTF